MAGIILGGRYELIREIGRGGSATVYLAHDRALDRQIAVKLIAPALANDPGFLDRFMREARISAGLSHPNILTVHDVGESDDHRPFLAISLVDGESLEQVIAQSGRLPLAEAARILGQLAAALDYLHAAGLIHRDVKPSNVLVEESGRVLLSDFGIAYARESTRYTATGMLLGTPRYMAPEQMRGEEPSPQTDVYAMGVLAFEMLAGVPPFEGTGTGLMYQIVHEPPPSLRAKVPDAPPGIEAVIARALEKDPAARWATPGEFAAAFAAANSNLTVAATAIAIGPAVVAAPLPPPLQPTEAVSGSSGGGPPTQVVAAEGGGPPTQIVAAKGGGPPPEVVAGEGGGRRGSGRRRTLAGLAALGALGLGLAGYCVAASQGGNRPAAVSAIGGTPTATVSAVPTPSPSTAASPPPTTGGAAVPPAATSAPSPAATAAPATATPTVPPTASPTPPPTATPTPAPPTAPSNVTLTGSTLSWSDNSTNESGFRIYWRATDLNSKETYVQSDATVGPNTTSTQVKTVILTATTTDFRRGVAAYNDAGESAIAWEP